MKKNENMTDTEHLNITKQMNIDGSSSVFSAKCKQMYISVSINIVKMSILIVSRQKGIPPGTGHVPLRRANAGLACVHLIFCDIYFIHILYMFLMYKAQVQKTGNVIVVSYTVIECSLSIPAEP